MLVEFWLSYSSLSSASPSMLLWESWSSDFIIYTRGGGSWYFRPSSRGGLANFTPIAGMGHLISEPKFKIPTPPPNFWQVPNPTRDPTWKRRDPTWDTPEIPGGIGGIPPYIFTWGGGRGKCIFKQEKQLLFKMSAGTNSRGNANEILGQCQYLSNYTPTPPLTTNSQLMTSQVNVGLEEG